MKTDTHSAELTENQKVFMDYVSRMPKTMGQKFITHLVASEGFNAFEDFMMKLNEASTQESSQLLLTDPEKKSLAAATHGVSRRSFLKVAGGMGLIAAGGVIGKSGVDDIRDDTPITFSKIAKIAVKAYGAGITSLFGGSIIAQQYYATDRYQISTIAKGEMGELRIKWLVSALDKMMKPIQVSLEESGAQRSPSR